MQANICHQISPKQQPILQGKARVFACVKGKLMVQVNTLPAVIRICGNIAPVFACSTDFLQPLECEVSLFSWCAKDNVFYGDVLPVMDTLNSKHIVRRRLHPIEMTKTKL
jgi:hypothetical protein